MRAAFICVNANKQVVILAPSTVLVSQHYQSFVDRFKKFGIYIKSLNRHSNNSEKTEIINDFNKGKIDILIGTHALFSQALNFKNMGLLVIDEEHRFGTKQKDIIKAKKPDVHVLYLSATPIPRTMNFIFAGLKDFSFLHTPPTSRLSIKSFLKVETDNLMVEAIKRENSRDGQCFVIQNDIKKLANLKDRLLLLLPDLRIEIAHGQLKKAEITKTMNLFQIGKIDVLLCTTIVEMGLDIPNANTMIILDAYNFGLAQLHQLRGRVGRSSKQGYCYFLIPTPDIPKSSRERLDSIIRLSDLGSGFFIAQEDLELRGGGEILGEKQSGHVDAIGISLYLSMLKDSIEGIKNPQYEYKSVTSEINFFDDAFIPDIYLPSPTERLKIYRRINEITKISDLFKLKIELIDRCGKYINEVDALFSNAELLILSGEIGISKISSHEDKTSIQFHPKLDEDVLNKILSIIRSNSKIYQMEPSGKLNISIEDSKNSNQRRLFVRNFINEIS
jgi:transcription-repair coupling factor (superfamily II helicase)